MHSLLALFAVASSLAAAAPAGKFTFYDVKTPLAGPCDLWDGHGYIWVDTLLSNKIVRVNPKNGRVTEFDIPYKSGLLPTSVLPSNAQGTVALACVVQPGEDGRMYFATGLRDQIARIDPQTNKVEVFGHVNLAGNLEPLNDAWPGPTGMFFSQTSGNVITLFDYNTTEFKDFPLPEPLSGPVGMRTAEDGALWFAEFLGQRIGRLNYTDGTIKEYPVPASLLGPGVMRVETKGRYLYFSATDAQAIGRIDIYTGEFKAYPITNGALVPLENTVDSKGNVWFSTETTNNLVYLTPKTGKFSTVEVPDTLIPGTLPIPLPPHADIAVHYVKDGNSIWFTELATNRIGRYRL